MNVYVVKNKGYFYEIHILRSTNMGFLEPRICLNHPEDLAMLRL